MSIAAQNSCPFPLPTLHEIPGNTDFLSKPWLRWATRKGVVGGRDVEHLYHLGQYAITKLCNSPPEDIPKYDIGEMNLICAYGLTGKHDIEIEAMLKTLDEWTDRVAEHTSARIGIFHKNSARFGTLARFRITAMVHVLTAEFNVHYNPDQVANPGDWSDHGDAFIHGALGPKRNGTCASLPVLFTAIGRRLGYPLYLTTVANHCLCRWDSPEERFNIEYSHGGLNSHTDEHYKKWPKEWTPEVHEYQRKRPSWLTSLTPQQDLGYCVHTRAMQLSVVGRHAEAHNTQTIAYQLWPNKGYGVWGTHLLTKKMYPEKKWPFFPCEETSGKEAFDRLIKEKGAVVVPSLDPRAQ